GIVKRGVVRIITPGTLLEPYLINETSNNYMLSLWEEGGKLGVCACDVSTGQVNLYETSPENIETELETLKPSEIIMPKIDGKFKWIEQMKRSYNFKETLLEHYKFDENNGEYLLNKILGVKSFNAYGIESSVVPKRALSGLLSYLEFTFYGTGNVHISRISYTNKNAYQILDATTIRNLDLIYNQIDGTHRGTLYSVLDKTVTPMGGRLLKKWITQPLFDKAKIEKRLDFVEFFFNDIFLTEEIRRILAGVGDIERIATRILYGNVQPRELLMLKQSIIAWKKVYQQLSQHSALKEFLVAGENTDTVCTFIDNCIDENAKQSLREGNVIRQGYSEELDKLRSMLKNSTEWIQKFEEEERARTGIKSLKVRYNKIIGYYIEVPKTQANNVPSDYVRKQTQVACERYISSKLKETEIMVLNAEEKISKLEQELYGRLIDSIKPYVNEIYSLSNAVGEIDIYSCFAKVSYENNYVRPEINETNEIIIEDGRHPVVEKNVTNFVSNSVRLDNNQKIMIITGPNMAGKSTIMRQVALITIMAHIGCFVPAHKASISLVDRIFTRVGARDDIVRGQSTFMMEMTESANILNNATEKSLVILDEIGRGTSTYDGIAIAWAIIEYIANRIGCKTMFATHYHLLNLLSLKYSFIRNFNVAVSENPNDIVFLHKLVEGGTDKSYGIHAAKVAGIPLEVVMMAREISKRLEENDFIHRETLSRLTRGSSKLVDKKQTSIDIWSV
ncbi:MAG: DNA mismatch repair protein MutS, partial [Candidatus Micrarchaeia archaeon]